MESCQVFLFGDLTVSFEDDLRQLLHVKGNGALSSFLDQVSFALREEFGKLSATKQDLLPNFTTLVDLLFKLREAEGAPALKSALLCLYQIGQFIRYGTKSYPLTSHFSSDLWNVDIMEKARDRFLIRSTHTWWAHVRACLLPLPSVPRKPFSSWFQQVSKQS